MTPPVDPLAAACGKLSSRVGMLAGSQALLALVLMCVAFLQIRLHLGGVCLALMLLLAGWSLRLNFTRRCLEMTLDDDGTPALRALLLELAAQAGLSSAVIMAWLGGRGAGWEIFVAVTVGFDWAVWFVRQWTMPGLQTSLRFLTVAILARMVSFVALGVASLFSGNPVLNSFSLVCMVFVAKELACTRRLTRFLDTVDPTELAGAVAHLTDLITLQAALLIAGGILGGLGVGVLWLLGQLFFH